MLLARVLAQLALLAEGLGGARDEVEQNVHLVVGDVPVPRLRQELAEVLPELPRGPHLLVEGVHGREVDRLYCVYMYVCVVGVEFETRQSSMRVDE